MDNMLEGIQKYFQSIDSLSLDEYLPNLKYITALTWNPNPFPYLVIDNIFSDTYAKEIRSYVEGKITTGGLSEKIDREIFSRMPNYDAYSLTPPPSLRGPLRIFYCREWHDLFKKISKLELDENIITVIHHHKIKSASGDPHSDYGTYAFVSEPSPNQLNHWAHNCIYQPENNPNFYKQKGVLSVRRSLAFIYYLGDTWEKGDGGETAFYNSSTQNGIVKKIAPIPNRLLVFQISPKSEHGFITNLRRERNCIVQWFHESIVSMDKRLNLTHTHAHPLPHAHST